MISLKWGGGSLCFTPNLGDSLVDKHLLQKLEYAKQRGVKHIYMYTNGILLSRKDTAERLIDYLDAIHISNPGLSKEAYLRLYQVDKCDAVVEGILRLARHKRLTGKLTKIALEFRIDRPISEVMEDEGMQQLKEYLADGTIEIGTTHSEMDNWGGAIDEEKLTGMMKLKKPISSARELPCQNLFQTPAVLPDGAARVCSCWYVKTNYDELTIDNVMDIPLSDILFGEKHRSILLKWTQNKRPLVCNVCTAYHPVTMSNKQLIKAIGSVIFHRASN